MANNAVQFLRLPVLASSGLAVVASGLLYFKQKCDSDPDCGPSREADRCAVS